MCVFGLLNNKVLHTKLERITYGNHTPRCNLCRGEDVFSPELTLTMNIDDLFLFA